MVPNEEMRVVSPIVLAVCGDAGGAASVAPVVALLQSNGSVAVRAVLYGQACAVWARHGLPFEEMPVAPSQATLAEMATKAAALLLGTSVNGLDYERRLAALVPERSVCVLDFWSNYSARFELPGGGRVQPAVICVMDAQARDGMIAEGFDPRRLEITGQPAFDELATRRTRFTPVDAKRIRDTFGVGDGERFVLFASQPLASLRHQPAWRTQAPPYDQHDVLRMLVRCLRRLAATTGNPIFLLVRPHPRENMDELAWVASSYSPLRVCVTAAGDGRDCALAADLVCGITSVFLLEACLLGALTVSIQPGPEGQDPLPCNSQGWSRLARTESEVDAVLEAWLLNDDARARQLAMLAQIRCDGGASQRVAEIVYRVIGLRKAGCPCPN